MAKEYKHEHKCGSLVAIKHISEDLTRHCMGTAHALCHAQTRDPSRPICVMFVLDFQRGVTKKRNTPVSI